MTSSTYALFESLSACKFRHRFEIGYCSEHRYIIYIDSFSMSLWAFSRTKLILNLFLVYKNKIFQMCYWLGGGGGHCVPCFGRVLTADHDTAVVPFMLCLQFDRNSSRYSSRRGRTIESLNSFYDVSTILAGPMQEAYHECPVHRSKTQSRGIRRLTGYWMRLQI